LDPLGAEAMRPQNSWPIVMGATEPVSECGLTLGIAA